MLGSACFRCRRGRSKHLEKRDFRILTCLWMPAKSTCAKGAVRPIRKVQTWLHFAQTFNELIASKKTRPRGTRFMNVSGTRLLLIRHAHVDTGTPSRMCGWLDLPLSPEGRYQVRSFSHPDSGNKPRALYTSPSMRARATAEALALAWKLEPDIEPALREIHCGSFEGQYLDKIWRDYRELWDRNNAQNDGDFAWPGGESYRNFRSRVLAALTRIAALHTDQSVAIVTHTGVITQVIGILENLSPAVWERYRPAPFSATEVLWRGDRPERLLSFNLQQWWRGSLPPAGLRAPKPRAPAARCFACGRKKRCRRAPPDGIE